MQKFYSYKLRFMKTFEEVTFKLSPKVDQITKITNIY